MAAHKILRSYMVITAGGVLAPVFGFAEGLLTRV